MKKNNYTQLHTLNNYHLTRYETEKACYKKGVGVKSYSGSDQGCQFCFVSSEIAEIFHTNSKNGTKQNKFHLILNLGPFRIFRLNSARNVPVSFHMFRSALEKSLNQIEPYSI